MNDLGMTGLNCKVCGNKLILDENFHYIARDEVTTGIVTIGRHDEEKLYDAFDCPFCSCQNIVGERKREYIVKAEELPDEIVLEEQEDKTTLKCFGSYEENDLDCALCTIEKECKKAAEGDKNEK